MEIISVDGVDSHPATWTNTISEAFGIKVLHIYVGCGRKANGSIYYYNNGERLQVISKDFPNNEAKL